MKNSKLINEAKNNITVLAILALVAVSSFLIGSQLQPKRVTTGGVTTVQSSTSGSTSSATSPLQEIKAATAQVNPTTTAPATASALVNINTASASELDALPHVGPATAQKIIDYRTQHGAFKSVDDLINVPGIGPKTLDDIKPKATI